MMKILRDIVYRPESQGVAGLGDLYVPEQPLGAALAIHGGGWGALDRYSFAGLAEFLCYAFHQVVFNIEYRLTGEAPWPACGDDCLTAAHFLRAQLLPRYFPQRLPRMLVVGASSGGHLSLITGLRLPPEWVSGIISISGIGALQPDLRLHPDRYLGLFRTANPTPEQLQDASPATYVTPASPRILCTHAIYDDVVPIESATDFMDAAAAKGRSVDSYFYNRRNDGHCIWIAGSQPHRLHPDIEAHIATFVASLPQ